MKSLFVLSPLLLFSILINSCSKEIPIGPNPTEPSETRRPSDSESDQNSTPPLSPSLSVCDSFPPLDPSAPNTTVASLTGIWKTPCTQPEIEAGLPYQTKTLETNGSHMNETITFYTDNLCTKQIFEINAESEWRLGQESTEVPNTTELDYVYKNTKIKILDTVLAQSLNNRKFCGFDKWQKGSLINVTGKNCGPDFQIPKSGDTAYGLIRRTADQTIHQSIQLSVSTKERNGKSRSTRECRFSPDSKNVYVQLF